MIEEYNTNCESCGSYNEGAFVQHGSYFIKCIDCGAVGVATSFISLSSGLTGEYEALEVDEENNIISTVAKGQAQDIVEKVTAEAGAGKLIWLKYVVN